MKRPKHGVSQQDVPLGAMGYNSPFTMDMVMVRYKAGEHYIFTEFRCPTHQPDIVEIMRRRDPAIETAMKLGQEKAVPPKRSWWQKLWRDK